MNTYAKYTWNNVRQKRTPKHIAVWENFMRTHVPNGCVIHHIDEDKSNDDIFNLVCMTRSEHNKWHGKQRKGTNNFHYGKSLSNEIKRKMSEARKGMKQPENVRKKISESHKGIKHSKETKKRLSEIRRGRKLSVQTKEKISKSNKGTKHLIVKCPYCGNEGGITGMKRWHFENCKEK